MDDLLRRLECILELIKQIQAITSNQTVVLLSETTEYIEDQSAVELLEGMVEYKEQLIQEVEYEEEQFNHEYEKYRGRMTDEKHMSLLKNKVSQILYLKNVIIENERSNLLIMLNKNRQIDSMMSIQKSPDKVIALYKKQVNDTGKEYR